MDINLNLGEWNSVFSVPSSVVDKHLKTASSVYVKVLLVILRNAGNRMNDQQISEQLSVPVDEVKEAVRYWEAAGIFSFGGNEGLRTSNITMLSSKPSYLSTIEISKLVETKPEVKFMFDKLELIYGRPVTSTEQRSYIYLYEAAGMPADVMVMIAEYCVSIDKSSIRYIEKTALNWADEGINSHEKAVERMLQLSEVHQAETKIKKCFGIDNRNLSANEKKYIKTWCNEYHFDLDMIKIAYDRTVDGIGKLSFPYVNTILKSWYDNHIKTAEDIQEKESPNRDKKAKRYSDSSYDLQEFDRLGYNIPEIEPETKES